MSAGTSRTRPARRAARPNDGRMPGDQVDVAGEVAGMVDRDERVPVGEDLDLALEHDHERTVRAARFEQDLADLEPSLAPERRDPFDLRHRQRREDFVLGSAGSGTIRTHVGDAISKITGLATSGAGLYRLAFSEERLGLS